MINLNIVGGFSEQIYYIFGYNKYFMNWALIIFCLLQGSTRDIFLIHIFNS